MISKQKILIIGNGGREHAIGWKVAQSSRVGKIFFAPGNGGTSQIGTNIDIKAIDISKLLEFVGSLTYSKTVFTKFDADREKGTMQLKGSAQNYTALAKQMVALRENENVKSLEVKNIYFGTSGLDFELTMLLDQQVFIR